MKSGSLVPGDPNAPRQWSPEFEIRVLRMHAVGWSVESISVQTGQTQKKVQQVIDARGANIEKGTLASFQRNHNEFVKWLDQRTRI